MWAVSDTNGLIAVLSEIKQGTVMDKLLPEALVMGNGIDKISTGLGAVITGEATTCCTV